MDWKGVIYELRLLAMELPVDRFYALYLLLALWVVKHLTRSQ
ncbi:hypothetical protein [Methylocaldum sp.]|nr:hypothetical protein [Methylocaldum sp.]HYE36742.1 hypothetical protein [Methylocaldum sp.]